MRKRERAADKAPKSPRPTVGGKSLASMGLQDVIVAPLSDSSSSGGGDSGRCHHMTLDSEDVEMAVLELTICEEPPTCHHPGCGITWKGASYDKEWMMQCLDCHYIGCTRGLDREDPWGHALSHAASCNHYVAQLYNVPNLGYCFKCVRVMRLSDSPELNEEECSEEDRKIKEQRAMVASKTVAAGKSKDDWGTTASSPRVDWPTVDSSPRVDWPTVASTPRVDWPTVASSSKVDLGNAARNVLDQWGMGAGNDMAESAIGNGYIIRGMPNHGNTCYMNASLQCLLALDKLRTIILGPDASDARLGTIGLELNRLFLETGTVNNARRMLDPRMILVCMQSLYRDRFRVGNMEDTHKFLTLFHTALDNEVEELNRSHVMEGGEVFPTFGHSIFSGQLIQTVSCKSCSYNSVTLPSFHGLQLGVPSKASPARSKPLEVDSTEVKDVVQSCMQTQKNDVPQEITEVPIDLDFIPNFFDNIEEMEESAADSHNRENKEKARGSDIVHDEAKNIDTLGSIEDCLTLFFHGLANCDNCSKVAELLETNASKSIEPIMASRNINTTVHGDQSLAESHQEVILSDEKNISETSCDEKDLASCSTANEKAESREGVQKAAPSCLTTDQQTDLLDPHSAQRVEETQNEQTDGNSRASQTQLISKLPPVLTIPFKEHTADHSKLTGHVSFKEILQLGPFTDPRRRCTLECAGAPTLLNPRTPALCAHRAEASQRETADEFGVATVAAKGARAMVAAEGKGTAAMASEELKVAMRIALNKGKQPVSNAEMATEKLPGLMLGTDREADASRSTTILKTKDGVIFCLPLKTAILFKTIASMIEDGCAEGVIPMPNVDSKTFAKILEYCKKHQEMIKGDSPDLDDWSWRSDFLFDLDPRSLLDMVVAADFLEHKGLLDLACNAVAYKMASTSTEQISETSAIAKKFPDVCESILQELESGFHE